MSNIIEVNDLCKNYVTYKRGGTFGEAVKTLFHREKIIVNAVKNVSFSAKQGELLGLLGPNGAGKSTTIKMLIGALFPSSGTINVNGCIPYKNRTKYVQNIGAIFGQKSQLIWDIPPVDSFLMNKAIYGIENNAYKQKLDELVSLLDVSEVMQKPTRMLSLGERMKCEFIMAMLHNPSIVFLDEPTIGLDIIAKEAVRSFIQKMNTQGVTFILTTHDLSDIEQLAQRVVVINHGSVVFDNSLCMLKSHLGNTKLIRVTMNTVLPNVEMHGLKVSKKVSNHEVELELDLSKTSVQSALDYINSLGEIADISIKELPIEQVIKVLYK